MTDQQKCLLAYLQTLRLGAVDTLTMAGMFFNKKERDALPQEVLDAYENLDARESDEVLRWITIESQI